MIELKSADEIALMQESAQLVSRTLGMLAAEIKPGVSALELDRRAEEYIRDHGGIPAFLGMYGFPNSLCMSRNEQVVHGIPSDQPLADGDIISVDCGVLMNDFYGDHAYTFEVGTVAPETRKLLEVTKASLYVGIDAMRRDLFLLTHSLSSLGEHLASGHHEVGRLQGALSGPSGGAAR
jgi:methionyl aminopeptidase